jgi:uncharacterized protein with FMN-binding domain
MRRITYWALSTVSVLALLFGYHTSTSGAVPTNPPTSIVAPIKGSTSSSSGTGSAGTQSSTSTLTGEVAQTQWGPVQVELTVADAKVTDVTVVQYPNGNGQDIEINNYALPVLIQETLDAQSANIDMVSGATVTSDGYLQSLQSALDQAGL